MAGSDGAAEAAYRATDHLPKAELYGLTSQSRRSAVLIAANIAEGWGRDNLGMYIQSLRIAQGSLKELETHMLLSVRLKLLPVEVTRPAMEKAERVGKLLRGLIRSLEAHQ